MPPSRVSSSFDAALATELLLLAAAVAFVARLGDNGVVWNILSFWRDPDDVVAVKCLEVAAAKGAAVDMGAFEREAKAMRRLKYRWIYNPKTPKPLRHEIQASRKP